MESSRLKSRKKARAQLASRVLEEMRRIALIDASKFRSGTGRERRVRPPEDWTAEMASQVAGFEVQIKNIGAGDSEHARIQRFRFWDKVRALEMLGKHFRLLTDLVAGEDVNQQLAELAAGRLWSAVAARAVPDGQSTGRTGKIAHCVSRNWNTENPLAINVGLDRVLSPK